MATKTGSPSFSCHCLNVQIDDVPTPGPSLLSDEAHSVVYVGEEGVHIAHTQFTARSRGLPRVVNAPGRPNSQEIPITLSCLVCNTEVYRVWWDHNPTLDGDSTSLLTSGEWAEGETLKARSGWIEVNRTCPSGPAVTKLSESASYSPLFHIVLPNTGQLTPPSPTLSLSYATTPRTHGAASEAGYVHLPSLPALFLPAPFTSSHPAFIHLSAVATSESQRLRNEAEEELSLATRRKLMELEHAEQELKRQVELIWHTFRDSVRNRTQVEQAAALERVRSPTRTVDPVLDFVPVPGTLPPSPPTSPAPRKSALSASLRQSGMHYVPKLRNQALDEADVPPSVPVLGRHARWSTDESANVAASLHWSSLEDNMRKQRKLRGGSSKVQDVEQPSEQAEAKDNGPTDHKAIALGASTAVNDERGRKPETRKVKFDARSEAVTAITDRAARQVSSTSLGPEESIFDFDIEAGTSLDVAEDDEKSGKVVQPPLALRQPASPPPTTRRSSKNTPLSFSALRPSSLPAPSHMQLAKLKEVVRAPTPPKLTTHSPRITSPPPLREQEQNSVHDMDGCNVAPPPGKDGRAWEIFTRNKGGKTMYPSGTAIEEEDESEPPLPHPEELSPPVDFSDGLGSPDDVRTPSSLVGGIPRSVPIPVGTLQTRRFQDLDYEPKTSLADRPGMRVPKLRNAGMPSSVAIRKANYAARDRQKGTDPGAFDFMSDDTDEEEEEAVHASERARQQAFNILKARSELPAAGMWRSLA